MKQQTYSKLTVNDSNPIKRIIHNKRFSDAVLFIHNKKGVRTVLDFGGGDGELCSRLTAAYPSLEITCYEPAPSMNCQAKRKIGDSERITLIDSIEEVPQKSIDVIYSLEVFEHLPQIETIEALYQIRSILKPDGTAIIGVPNEMYFAALYKGIFRMVRRFNSFDAKPTNILLCSLGIPPHHRPVGKISEEMRYHYYHLGFDHRSLKKLLKKQFKFVEIFYSPWKYLGPLSSPEIYFIVQKG